MEARKPLSLPSQQYVLQKYRNSSLTLPHFLSITLSLALRLLGFDVISSSHAVAGFLVTSLAIEFLSGAQSTLD